MVSGVCEALQGAVLDDLAGNAAQQLSNSLDGVVLRGSVQYGVEVCDVPHVQQGAVYPAAS